MKNLILLLVISLASVAFTTKQEAATITSVTHTQAGDVVCFNWTATDIEGVYMEVKSRETGDQFRPTACSDCGTAYMSNASSGSLCKTYSYKGAKGRTYRLVIVRKSDWSRIYSNEVSL
jgi:hypothetical protein